MSWKLEDSLDSDFSKIPKTETPTQSVEKKAIPPASNNISGGVKRPRQKGRGNANEAIKMPSGKSYVFSRKLVDPSRCKVFIGNQRAYSELDVDSVTDILPSIKESGVLDPLVARPATDDPNYDYEIIDGSRRLFASKNAGIEQVPIDTANLSDEDAFYLTAVQNIYDKPSPYEIGLFSLKLGKDENSPFKTWKDFCTYQGINKSTYYRCLNIVNLPDYVLDIFANRKDIPEVDGDRIAAAIKTLFKRNKSRSKELEESLRNHCGKAVRAGLLDNQKAIKALDKWIKETEKPKAKQPPKPTPTTQQIKDDQGNAILKTQQTTKNTLKIEVLVKDEEKQQLILEYAKKLLSS